MTEQIAARRDMANAIRALAMDAVQQADSGHPGMPMGMADAATVLFTKFLKFDASEPRWPDRDRFILSAGHGSMLLYSLLHLTGYADMTLDELKHFRQLGSRTAGHPEHGHASGIETTTGPLGQGLGNSVGFALAERLLADRFGRDIVDHYTYVICGDGCLMEGVGQEAITLAGHLGLGRLILLFDDNKKRFAAAGWHVQAVDGLAPDAVTRAIRKARNVADKPSLIACKTVIGYGAPTKAGTAATHGSSLGKDEVAGARQKLGWNHPPFDIPEPIFTAWRKIGARGKSARRKWTKRHAAMADADRAAFDRRLKGDVPPAVGEAIAAFKAKVAAEKPSWATRKSSQEALEVINPILPDTVGGSADLTGSNNTKTATLKEMTRANVAGRYIHYGIREHAMAAAMNGMALHGGVIPYGGTFLVFTDYCRPSIRLAALMGLRVVYVMTHDSIGLGEDGPTHQPVEHLAALRAIPGRRHRDGGVLADRARVEEDAQRHRAHAPERADLARRGRRQPLCPRGLYPGRRCIGRRPPHRFGLGSPSRRRRARAACPGRHLGRRCIDAVLGVVRQAGRHISGTSAGRRWHGKDRLRGGVRLWLGALAGDARRFRRHEELRGVGHGRRPL